MFNDNSQSYIQKLLEKIISNTNNKTVGVKKVDDQFTNMNNILEYYNQRYSEDFQKITSENLRDFSYEGIIKELNHDRADEKQRDEGKDKELEDIERNVNEQINKSKMPSNTLDKENILKELEEMTEDEENITKKDIQSFVRAATVKAIYKATLEKYENNRAQIQKHTDIVRNKYGDFALEDRLALENRQYEVYLQKLAKQYQEVDPKHRSITEDKDIKEKSEEMKKDYNKKEKINEERKKDEIIRITRLYDEKEEIEREMSYMAANPAVFSKERFEELKGRLYQVDMKLCYEKTAPAVLTENIEREERQKTLENKEVGNNPDKKTVSEDKENIKKEEKNTENIRKETRDSAVVDKELIKEMVEEYHKCRNKGDIEGAITQYKSLAEISRNKDILSNNLEENTKNKEGKKEFKTDEERKDNLRDELNLNGVDDENLACLDAMDAEVDRIAEDNQINEEQYKEREKVPDNNAPVKQHTLYNKK